MAGTFRNTFAVWAAIALMSASARAAELLPPDRALADVIDHYVDAKLGAASVTPAPPADDSTLLRRTMLDLVGRPPTTAEAQAYLAADSATKRATLVQRLLASPGFVRHQVNQFDVLLSGSGKGGMREYLKLAIADNRPWDAIFRELMAADESDPARKGAAQFLKSRVSELDRVTNETSVVFFGINVSCAKCHDHPLVPNWTQEHYFGMASFFNRTFDNDGFLAEREYGLVDYETTSGAKKTAKLMFLSGTVLEEPMVEEPSKEAKKEEKERIERAKKDKQPLPPPAFSRRAQLPVVALAPENRQFFAKAIVNQLWNRFYGYGLVMPVDQLHSENPPSHPELLEWLARDLVEHQYDLKRTIEGLVLSRAYARSSRWQDETRPDQTLFAVANVRPLTPPQYAAVLGLGTTAPDQFPPELSAEELDNRTRGAEEWAKGTVDKLEYPGDGFQVSVDEALLLTNSDKVMREVLRDNSDSLLAKLKATTDRRAALTMATWNVLGRAPADEELAILESYLERRADRLADAWKQLTWALLTSTEARFNH
jgi:hypothetical protein